MNDEQHFVCWDHWCRLTHWDEPTWRWRCPIEGCPAFVDFTLKPPPDNA